MREVGSSEVTDPSKRKKVGGTVSSKKKNKNKGKDVKMQGDAVQDVKVQNNEGDKSEKPKHDTRVAEMLRDAEMHW